MSELKIEKEKVLEAAKQCPEAKKVLETLFPDVFESKFQVGDIVEVRNEYGRIVYIKRRDESIGVELMNYHRLLHACDGYAKEGHGWWHEPEELQLIYRRP